MSSAQEAADEDAAGESVKAEPDAASARRGRGANAVGARVRVAWPEDEDWYEAVVRAFSAATGRHNVWYLYDEQARPALPLTLPYLFLCRQGTASNLARHA